MNLYKSSIIPNVKNLIFKLENVIRYEFNDKNKLVSALVHRSFANENRHHRIASNERLEFLGDSVLGFLVSRYLYENFDHKDEGWMTRIRADLVCEDSLADIAERLNLKNYILLGKGAANENVVERTSILADTVESIIASIFLDGGITNADKFVNIFVLDNFENKIEKFEVRDKKTLLQNKLQENGECEIKYITTNIHGLAHDLTFEAAVIYNGKELARGVGHSKKAAQQRAAGKALEILESDK